jgi:hypothetical protein
VRRRGDSGEERGGAAVGVSGGRTSRDYSAAGSATLPSGGKERSGVTARRAFVLRGAACASDGHGRTARPTNSGRFSKPW